MKEETGVRRQETGEVVDAFVEPADSARTSDARTHTSSPVSCLLSPVFYLPLLFILYPIISLYSLNQREVPIGDLGRPVVVALMSTLVLSLVFRLLSRDRDTGRSALALSLLYMAFFLFDIAYWYLLLPVWRIFNFLSEATISVLWQIGCLTAILWALRTRYPVNRALPAMTIAGAVLFVPPLLGCLWNGWRYGVVTSSIIATPTKTVIPPSAATHASSLPDLYCIVLDAYGRQDVLERLYGVDNEPFLKELEQKGFFVARHSRANYIQTALAIDATLNGNYLKTTDMTGIDDSVFHIAENRTTKVLQNRGFRIVYVPTTFPLASIDSPDIRLETVPPLTEIFTPLERLVLEKTPLSSFMVQEHVAFDKHRLRLLAALDDIKTAARMPEPKFVLSHILAPHPPFVFGAKGEPIYPELGIFKIGDATDYTRTSSQESYRNGYANQVRYLNQKLLETIETIQRESKRPAIIVLLGDHGPRRETDWRSLEHTNVHEVFYNLLVVAAPAGKLRDALADDMTPISLFRLILTDVYGENLPPLPDKSYYSTLAYPYHFTDVTAQVAGAEAEEGSGFGVRGSGKK